MAVHAVEPTGHPATACLEKGDLESREPVAHAAHDEARRRRHHLERMCHDVTYRPPSGETIHAQGRLAAFGASMDTDGKVDFLRFTPERVKRGIVQGAAVIGVRPDKAGAEAQ